MLDKFAPVLIVTLCRFEHFKNCIESLDLNDYAEDTEVFLGIDYPSCDTHVEGHKRICEYIDSHKFNFKKLHVIKHRINKGELENFKSLHAIVSEKYDRFISCEDDLIFSKYFLLYMNEALDYIKNKGDIFAVVGYSFPVEWDDENRNVIMEQSFFSAWGYGTYYRKKLEYEIFTTNDNYRKYNKNKNIRYKIWRGSKAGYLNFIGCIWNGIQSFGFDIKAGIFMQISEKYCLMPTMSLVRNCGWDGSGIHCHDNLFGYDFDNQPIYTGNSPLIYKLEGIRHIPSNEIKINVFLKPRWQMWIKGILKVMLIRLGLLKQNKC